MLFDEFQSVLSTANISQDPSEVHGLMTGFMCAYPGSTSLLRATAYNDWLGVDVNAGLEAHLNALFDATEAELDEFSDFQFRVLMPDDDTAIDTRSKSLKSFCAGFLSGFGATKSSEDVMEALSDFERIASLRETVEESEENESDLFEIIEFVRVSVLLIFAECRTE